MTTLISWKAIDSRGISSIYLASDSRFSWGDNKHWDCGQKIYKSINYPEMIGYCGDVLVSISIISSLMLLIDNEIIYKNSISSIEKHERIIEYIRSNFNSFPISSNTNIIHITKDLSNKFSYYEIRYKYDLDIWEGKLINLDESKDLIGAYGSGASYYTDKLQENMKNELYDTSRLYYMIFSDTLKESRDLQTGGVPQLASLYRGMNKPRNIGCIWNGNRYFNGIKLESNFTNSDIEWRNENFERYRSDKIEIIEGAQVQPRPRNMKGHPSNKL